VCCVWVWVVGVGPTKTGCGGLGMVLGRYVWVGGLHHLLRHDIL